MFSVVDRILFRSLPYPQADRLVSLGMVAPIAPQEFMLGYDSWTGAIAKRLLSRWDPGPVRETAI